MTSDAGDLLHLGEYKGVAIVSPRDFGSRLKNMTRPVVPRTIVVRHQGWRTGVRAPTLVLLSSFARCNEILT